MNAIDNIPTNCALGVAIDRMIHSALSAAAGALGLALVSVPWYSAVAQPSNPGEPVASIDARSKERAVSEDAIRPFRINVPQSDLDDLRRRLLATRWPTKELVADRSQGVQTATLRELVRY